MTMRTSASGIAALAFHEGVVPIPYLDSEGIWTFGVGHTAAAGAPNPENMSRTRVAPLDEVFELFAKDLISYEDRVNQAVKVELKQHEFDALVSFDYNTGGIFRALLTVHLNAGRRQEAAAGFMGWLKPISIKRRREAEQRLFRDGVYPGGRIPIWATNSAGKLLRVTATLTADEAIGLLPKEPVYDTPVVEVPADGDFYEAGKFQAFFDATGNLHVTPVI